MKANAITYIAGLVLSFLLLFCLPARSSDLAKYARANPENPGILNSYGIELANSGNLTEAIRVWRRALDFAPQNVHLYNNIGSALKRLGHDQHAFAWYAAALKIQPTYWTYYNLALIYRDRNQINDAVWSLNQAIKLNNGFVQAEDLLRRLEAGMLRVDSGNAVKTPVSAPDKIGGVAVRPIPGVEKKTEKSKRLIKSNLATKAREPMSDYSQTSVTSYAKILPLPGDEGGQVFLTFDGGADDDGFAAIMSGLESKQAKCTFFLTGKFVRQYPDKARELLARGHEIANHSMNHPDMKNFSAEKIAAEIEAAEEEFVKALGRRGAPFFRFPFGHQNPRVERIVETLGYRPVYWHIDTIDWREDAVPTIIARVNKKLCRGAVILMHIGSKNGAKALPRILDIITSRGYQLARLSDLDPSQLAALP